MLRKAGHIQVFFSNFVTHPSELTFAKKRRRARTENLSFFGLREEKRTQFFAFLQPFLYNLNFRNGLNLENWLYLLEFGN